MSFLHVHSDVQDAASERLEKAVESFIGNANGMFAYILGDQEKLENHCRCLISDYLALGGALAPLTDRYLNWSDPSPQERE